jgi:hypothetical protein
MANSSRVPYAQGYARCFEAEGLAIMHATAAYRPTSCDAMLRSADTRTWVGV